MAIVWRDKLLAFGIHFVATALLAACAAALIFLVWYPDPFQAMVRGTELFLLVVGCDLALGPLLSFVVFNRSKTRRALVIDYTFIATVQIAGMVYGVYTVAEQRPVYLAFCADRLEVVAARDLAEAELAAASEAQYRKVPVTGPRLVSVKVPEADRQQAMFDELDGKPPFLRPRWYHEYANGLPEIQKHLSALEELEKRHPDTKPLIAAALAETSVPAARLRWIPVSTRRGFWTALVDYDTGLPATYFHYDPY